MLGYVRLLVSLPLSLGNCATRSEGSADWGIGFRVTLGTGKTLSISPSGGGTESEGGDGAFVVVVRRADMSVDTGASLRPNSERDATFGASVEGFVVFVCDEPMELAVGGFGTLGSWIRSNSSVV